MIVASQLATIHPVAVLNRSFGPGRRALDPRSAVPALPKRRLHVQD